MGLTAPLRRRVMVPRAPRPAPPQNAITGKYRKGKPPLINNKNVRTPTNKFEAKWDEGIGKPKPKPKPEPAAGAPADPKAAGAAGAAPAAGAKAAAPAADKAAAGAKAAAPAADKAAAGAGAKPGAKPAVEEDDDDGAKEEPKLWVGNFRCVCTWVD